MKIEMRKRLNFVACDECGDQVATGSRYRVSFKNKTVYLCQKHLQMLKSKLFYIDGVDK